MKIRLFDPTGLKAVDYKATYPELARTEEFESMRGNELIFVWYYANATSPLIDIKDESKRVTEAIKASGYNPDPDDYEKLLKLQFPPGIEAAIEKMSSYMPGARYFGWKALKNIFDQYQDIANMTPSDFTKKVGSGDTAETITDYAAYSTVTGTVSKALADLIHRLEEGFGISVTGKVSDSEEESNAILRDWNLNKKKTS